MIAPAFTIAFDGTPVSGCERDRVERVAGRLDPDARGDGLRAEQVEREGVGQRLRDRLEREADPRVARLVHGAVDRRDRDPEERRVDVGELRDVRRERAAVEPAEPLVEVVEEVLDRAAKRLGGVIPRGGLHPLDPTLDLHRRADLLQRKEAPERTSAPRPRCRERQPAAATLAENSKP